MDFVTITDHDTIDGVLAIARPPRRLHLRGAHRRLPRRAARRCTCSATASPPTTTNGCRPTAATSRLCAAYMHEREIACALAHPYYTVAAPLTRATAAVWPSCSTSGRRATARAPELNRPAATYVATRDGIGIGGSDDHAGVDIGRTFTEHPGAATGRVPRPHAGREASGTRQAGQRREVDPRRRSPSPRARSASGEVSRPASDPRRRAADDAAAAARGRRPRGHRRRRPDARGRPLAAARVARVGRPRRPRRARTARLHAGRGLQPRRPLPPRVPGPRARSSRRGRRRARRRQRPGRPRRRRTAASSRPASPPSRTRRRPPSWPRSSSSSRRCRASAHALQAGATSDDGSEDGEALRVALLADGIGAMHGVTRTILEIRERGVPGFEIEVIGTDPEVDRRLPAVAEIDVPFYPGLRIGVPSLPAAVRPSRDGRLRPRPRLLPGPGRDRRRAAGASAAAAAARQLPHRAHRLRGPALGRERTSGGDAARGRELLRRLRRAAVAEPGIRRELASIGISAERVLRWDRGVDTSRFDPGLARPGAPRGRGQRPLRRADHAGEGRRPARPGVPGARASATRGCTSCSPAAAPSRSVLAERLGRARDVPRLARGRRARACLRQRRRVPVPEPRPTPSAR